jgi:zinc transport system ATP-binding protein
MTAPVLEMRQVTAGYGGRPVIHGVTLSLARGEVVAVLGANGSGKSTVLRAALGLIPLTAGSVRLFGAPSHRFRHRHRIGYVPQRLGAGTGVPATVAEVVSSGRLARRGMFTPARAADRGAVARAIETVGLTGRTADPVGTLSGGLQQRTLIARALAGEPDLLVLDEPTAGVDAASQVAFAAAVRGFVAAGGSVLLVAHELGPLEPSVDRAVVLHGGRVAHDGAVPEPAGYHARPGHDHVHPHARQEPPGIWLDGGARP